MYVMAIVSSYLTYALYNTQFPAVYIRRPSLVRCILNVVDTVRIQRAETCRRIFHFIIDYQNIFCLLTDQITVLSQNTT